MAADDPARAHQLRCVLPAARRGRLPASRRCRRRRRRAPTTARPDDQPAAHRPTTPPLGVVDRCDRGDRRRDDRAPPDGRDRRARSARRPRRQRVVRHRRGADEAIRAADRSCGIDRMAAARRWPGPAPARTRRRGACAATEAGSYRRLRAPRGDRHRRCVRDLVPRHRASPDGCTAPVGSGRPGDRGSGRVDADR